MVTDHEDYQRCYCSEIKIKDYIVVTIKIQLAINCKFVCIRGSGLCCALSEGARLEKAVRVTAGVKIDSNFTPSGCSVKPNIGKKGITICYQPHRSPIPAASGYKLSVSVCLQRRLGKVKTPFYNITLNMPMSQICTTYFT